MPARVPLEERRLIVRLYIEGVSQREICRRTGRTRTAVSRITQAYRDEARLGDAHRTGRQRITREEEDQLIVAAAVADPFLSARDIREALSLNVSCKTIQRRLQEAGLQNHIAAQKPLLTESQRRARLEFAREVAEWTVENWREVVFTDESTFSTRWHQQQRVWRPFNCRYETFYFVGFRHMFGGGVAKIGFF